MSESGLSRKSHFSGVIKQEGFVRFAIILLLLTQAAQAQSSFGKNLIVNGDAESGAASPSAGAAGASIPGWTASGSPNVLPYSLSNRLSTTSIGPVKRGANYFAGLDTAK